MLPGTWHGRTDRDKSQICQPRLYFPTLFACHLHITLHPPLYFTFLTYENGTKKTFLMYGVNPACAKSYKKAYITRQLS